MLVYFSLKDALHSVLYTPSLHDALPIFGADLARGSQQANGNGQVKARAFLGKVGRRQRNGGAPRGQLKTGIAQRSRSEEHTSELQSRGHLVCRLLLEKKNTTKKLSWS